MSHHGSSSPDENPLEKDAELRARMHELNSKLLGEFPDGKSSVEDEGAIAMVVKTEGGVVKLVFGKPVAWVGLTPEQAAQLGSDLIKQAARAGHMPFVLRIGE